MKDFEEELIFSQRFPDAQPMAMLRKADELRHTIPAGEMAPAPSFEDMLKKLEENYTYKPKPDAAEKSKQFITQAIAVCRDFEINTEIYRRRYEIAVTMDIYYAWYGGLIKHAFDTLMGLADDFSLFSGKCSSEYVRITMAYHTHEKFFRGKKVEWW